MGLVLTIKTDKEKLTAKDGEQLRKALCLDEHDSSEEVIKIIFPPCVKTVSDEFSAAFLLPTTDKYLAGKIPGPTQTYWGPYQIAPFEESHEAIMQECHLSHRIGRVITHHGRAYENGKKGQQHAPR